MLKIKDDVDLKELEKFGFKFNNKPLELLLCGYYAPIGNFICFYKDKTYMATAILHTEELQAINQKCKELKWID